MNNEPKLTEPGINYYLKETLKECKKVKKKINARYVNICAFIIFVLVLTSILMYRYKGRISKEEQENNSRKKKEYIIQKLQRYAAIRNDNNMITNLPTFDSHPENYNLQKNM